MSASIRTTTEEQQLHLLLEPSTGVDHRGVARGTLADRLYRLGLAPGTIVTTTRNRTVLVSWHPRGGLRLHAGYAWAPDDVLHAIIRFLQRRVPRAERAAARRRFMAFPVDTHAPSRPPRPIRPRAVAPEHERQIERLTRLHEIFNTRHFNGELGTIPIRISDRMKTRLGELRADSTNTPVEITLSSRHIRRDGWTAAAETLLHEMVHQWQCETGHAIGHGPDFRRKARQVGIRPAAVIPAGYLHCIGDTGPYAATTL